MADGNCHRNSSSLGTNTNSSVSKPPRQSKWKELFSSEDEPIARPAGVPPFTKNLDRNGNVAITPALSVTTSKAPSAASTTTTTTTYTDYEKLMQFETQKNSGSGSGSSREQLKVSVLQHACMKKNKFIEKCAEGDSQGTTSSTRMKPGIPKVGGAVVVAAAAVVSHDDVDGAKILEVENKEENQYEGDDELSSEESLST